MAVAAQHGTLVANTVTTVTLTGSYGKVEVLNRGTGTIYITYGGVTPADPTVAGDETLVVPAGACLTIDADARGSFKVKLISAAADNYSVQGVNE